MRGRERRRSEGFTLIEVVVAMGILATGLLAVSAAQLYAMRGGRRVATRPTASEIAQSQIENFQRMAVDGLAPTGGSAPPAACRSTTNVETTGATAARAELRSSAGASRTVRVSGRVFLKTIDVRVDWNEPNRPGRSYTVTTMRHNDARSVN